VPADRVAVEQAADDLEGRVGPPAPRGRVDAAHLELRAVLTTEPDAHGDPTGCGLGEGGDLAGGHHRVPQGEQQHAERQVEARLHPAERGERHDPVGAVAAPEADVVGEEQVVDAGVGDGAEQRPLAVGRHLEQAPRRGDADAHGFAHVAAP